MSTCPTCGHKSEDSVDLLLAVCRALLALKDGPRDEAYASFGD